MERYENIGKAIKQKRRAYGIKQTEFALRTGVGLATLRDIEQGKTSVKLSSLIIVLNALGLKIKLEDK